MSQKYFKPQKKYVSKALAIQKLKITPKQFDRMVVLSSIYPVLATDKNRLDKAHDWYYRIEDIKKIYYSDAYDVLLKNKCNETKRERCLKFSRIDKVECFKEVEYGLVELVKNKYGCLGDSLNDLGNSLRNLYFIKMLGIEQVDDTIDQWESFILENRLLENAFLSKKGIYFSFSIEKIRIVWSVPYPMDDFSQIIEEKKDIEHKIKTSGIKFLDFSSSSEESGSESESIDPNDANKLDVSLLRYACNLLAMHVKLSIHKLKLLYGTHLHKKDGIFQDKKICVSVKSIPSQLEFILQNEGAILTSLEEAKIVIAETVDSIQKDVVYIQPQYVFDSMNKNASLDHELYWWEKSFQCISRHSQIYSRPWIPVY